MLYAAIFILSLSSLSLEVLLTRIFSITQWNHLSFMVISIALFGLAASGTALCLFRSEKKGLEEVLCTKSSITAILTTYSAITIFSLYLVLNKIPLDYFRIPVEPVQLLYLLLTYLLLTIPFFICGLLFSASYAMYPDKSGFLYFASMSGSACGAILPLFLINYAGEGWLIVIISLFPLFIGIAYVVKSVADSGFSFNIREVRKPSVIIIVCVSTIIYFVLFGITCNKYGVNPSHYKALSQILKFPGTSVIETKTNIRGRIDIVKSPYLRFAPGLSIKNKKELPKQYGAYSDGDSPLAYYILSKPDSSEFVRNSLAWAAYLDSDPSDSILVIARGGGSAIVCAKESDSEEITIIQENPVLAEFTEDLYKLKVLALNHRSFLSVTDNKYDIIHIDNPGASIAGVSALEQSHDFTVEAISTYFDHLAKNGKIVIVRKLLLPPSDMLRMFSSSMEALKESQISSPHKHMAILRNWDHYVFLIFKKELKSGTSLIDFSDKKNFDVVYLPDNKPHNVNKYNQFDKPFHHNEINKLLKSIISYKEATYRSEYILNISPQFDNTPFPYKFVKWSKQRDIYNTTGKRVYSLFLSGEIVVLAVLAESSVLAFILILLPFIFIKDPEIKSKTSGIVYFFLSGAGYMFIEMYFIKSLILATGNQVLSFSFVLCLFLITSGFGGYISQYLSNKAIKPILIILSLSFILLFLSGNLLLEKLLTLNQFQIYMISAIILIAPGILTGIPFSLGMRHFNLSRVQRNYAWALSGSASVFTAVLSAHIALNSGLRALILSSVLCYLFALLGVKKQIN